jgi:hypothetical protein
MFLAISVSVITHFTGTSPQIRIPPTSQEKAIHPLTAVLMSFEESAAANFRCRPRSHSRMIGPTKKRAYGIVVVRGAADNEAINTIATGMM